MSHFWHHCKIVAKYTCISADIDAVKLSALNLHWLTQLSLGIYHHTASPEFLFKKWQNSPPLHCHCIPLIIFSVLVFSAVEKLTGQTFEDYSFKVSYILDMDAAPPLPATRNRRGGRTSREQDSQPGTSGGSLGLRQKQPDFPLRMLVPTQFVGAIIGKEGLTIKNITKQTQSKWVWCIDVVNKSSFCGPQFI